MKNKGRFILMTVTIIAVMVCLLVGMASCGLFDSKTAIGIDAPKEASIGLNVEIKIELRNPINNGKVELQFVGENTCQAIFKKEKSKNYIYSDAPGKVTIRAVYYDNDKAIATSNKLNITFYANRISTAEELAEIENSKSTYLLSNDIDLSTDNDWTPIENFTGVLVGGGYSIKNLTLKVKSSDNVGLFGELKGTVTNLKIENVKIQSSNSRSNVGAIAGKNSGTISNCDVSGIIDCQFATCVGGVTGYSNTNLFNNVNNAKVISYEKVGGIAGCIKLKNKDDSFASNTNNGEISGSKYVGGVAGSIESIDPDDVYVSKITDNTNKGKVTASGDCVGGIAGQALGQDGPYYKGLMQLEFADCINEAEIIGKNYVAGIYGFGGSEISSVSTCENTADILGENYVGGIIGYSANTNVFNMNNNNNITGKAYVGGIAGYAGEISNCKNSGQISSKGTLVEGDLNEYLVGGIAGYCTGVENCENSIDITLDLQGEFVGGIAGYIYCTGKIDNNVNNGVITAALSKNVGGIVGKVQMPSKGDKSINSNVNESSVMGASYVGGLFGAIMCADQKDDVYTTTVSDNTNNGKVTASSDYAGGVSGYVTGKQGPYYKALRKIVVTSNINNASVTASSNAAAIVGKVGSYVNSTNSAFWSTNKDSGNVSTLYN